MMCQMAYSLKSVMPYQIGFKQASIFLMSQLQLLPTVAAGRYPEWQKVSYNQKDGKEAIQEQ